MIQFLKNYFWHLPKAVIASMWYSFPATELVVIGVTGTKGKTTTSHLIYHILKETGHKVGLISSIGAFFDDQEIDTGFHVTTPDSFELQRLLRLAVKKGMNEVVLEVTSNGLDQFRVWGVPFNIGVITNIYSDHLDYHKTMENYVSAKAKLISLSEKIVISRAVHNLSDFERVATQHHKTIHFFTPKTSFEETNKEAALIATRLLGVLGEDAQKALKTFPGVPGRMETVQETPFAIVIDFAHTPDSFDAALREFRMSVKKGGRLIAVFGCAGERDHGRRRMGEVAAKKADFFVITAEDPRTEKVEEISEEIARWAEKAGAKDISKTNRQIDKQINRLIDEKIHVFIKISDRQEAINYAISLAKSGDVVGLFGKGHEKSMCYGKTERSWSEHKAVKLALKVRERNLETQNSNPQLKSKNFRRNKFREINF